jgi:hypothetical protein
LRDIDGRDADLTTQAGDFKRSKAYRSAEAWVPDYEFFHPFRVKPIFPAFRRISFRAFGAVLAGTSGDFALTLRGLILFALMFWHWALGEGLAGGGGPGALGILKFTFAKACHPGRSL